MRDWTMNTPPARHVVNGCPVFDVGRYQVTVDPTKPAEECLSYRARDWNDKDRMPEVEIRDREICIDFDSIVDAVLARANPADLAAALWENNSEVQEAFVDRLVSMWGEPYGEPEGALEAARERVLDKLGRDILARRLNKVANVLRSAEYYERKYWELHHALNWVRTAEDVRGDRPDFLPPFTTTERADGLGVGWVQEDPEYKIGSRKWEEARDWWRAKLVEAWGLEPVLLPADASEEATNA